MSEAKTKKSVVTRAFLILTAVLILVSLLNWGVVTSWGKVRITRETVVGNNGLRYSALVYVPKEAKDDHPVPAILMLHGASGNARNHEAWATEFSRRGFAVMSIDNIGAGDGEYDTAAGLNNNSVPFVFYKQFMDLPFIDKDKIVISGHSMGGYIMVALMEEFGEEYGLANTYLFCDGIADNSPYGKMPEELAGTANVLGVWGLADKNWDPIGGGQRPIKTLMTNMFRLTGHPELNEDNIEIDKVYGSFEEGNACMLTFVPGQIHEGVFVNPQHIEKLLDFTGKSIGFPNELAPNDQVWRWKDNLGLLGMFTLVAWMICLALVMVEKVPFFASVKQPLPRNMGMRKAPMAISIVAAVLFPILCLYTAGFGLIDAMGWRGVPNQSLFALSYTNVAFGLVITMNLFGLVMFFVYHFTWGKKKFGADLRDYGLTSEGKKTVDWSLIGKSVYLAVLVIFCGWSYLRIQGDVLGTDFYCMFWGLKPMVLRNLPRYIPYMVVWTLCFIVAGLGMNVERRLPDTGNATRDTVLQVLFNVVVCGFAITFMVLLENHIQRVLGYTGKALPMFKTDITRIWGMPVGLTIGIAGNSYVYRKLGSIYPGAILMGCICALQACLYGQLKVF